MQHNIPNNPFARRLSNQLSESESGSRFTEPPYTKERPPTLKESNFSAANMNGPVDESTLMHTSLDEEFEILCLETAAGGGSARTKRPTTSDSGNTDSTAKGDAGAPSSPPPVPPVPSHLYALLSHDFGGRRDYDGAVQPLTEEAMRALDSGHAARPNPGDLAAWVEAGRFPFGAQQPLDLSSSLMVSSDHSRAATTHGTPSSWDVVVAVATQSPDQTAEYVCAAGLQFENASGSYHMYGPNIPDEFMRD